VGDRRVPGWRLAGKVILITGASQGIGRALALRLAAERCRLVLVARSAADLDRLAHQCRSEAGSEAVAVSGDVSDPGLARRAVDQALRTFSGLDVLVNNAGVGLRAPIARLSPKDLEDVFRVNVVGAVHFTQAAVPCLLAQGHGLIVNISSAGARQALPCLGGYGATKAALASISSSLRLELDGTGVKVLTVFPGSVETAFKTAARGEPYPERKKASRLSPEEVAERILLAAESGRREVHILSRGERLGLLLGRVLPRLVEKQLIRRYGDRP
jgi:short-subunit dehydrogenase